LASGRQAGSGERKTKTMAAESTVHLTIPSEIRMVDVAHATAERLAGTAGFAADASLDFGIAVRETVINAIVHGNRRDPARDVDISFRLRSTGIEASVRDSGNGFDPAGFPDPTSRENILNTSGRGLLMVRAFVDHVEFRTPSGGGTEVVLGKALPD
jgi:serine/threonine-protein kinase RsbW